MQSQLAARNELTQFKEEIANMMKNKLGVDMGNTILSQKPYTANFVSMRKVVSTLTSKSAEIYLSMVGAKQLVTRGLSWFRPGPYVQQWCARGTILRCTVVLAEGSDK
jgi:hypothetical protein